MVVVALNALVDVGATAVCESAFKRVDDCTLRVSVVIAAAPAVGVTALNVGLVAAVVVPDAPRLSVTADSADALLSTRVPV